jgi:hypothetical protein
MKFYKYKSAENLWQLADIIVRGRLFCAKWDTLNDPLEGRYEVFFNPRFPQSDVLLEKLETRRNTYRIASFSSVPDNFLMWSHYADGHKGVAIELEIDSSHRDLFEVVYSPFSSVFSSSAQISKDVRHIFNGKTEAWSYEKEYRIITTSTHFKLPNPVHRVLLGPLFDPDRRELLRSIIPGTVEIVQTTLDRTDGVLKIMGAA